MSLPQPRYRPFTQAFFGEPGRMTFVGYIGELDVWHDTDVPADYALVSAPHLSPFGTGTNIVWLRWDGAWFVPAYSQFIDDHATPAQVCDIAAAIAAHHHTLPPPDTPVSPTKKGPTP